MSFFPSSGLRGRSDKPVWRTIFPSLEGQISRFRIWEGVVSILGILLAAIWLHQRSNSDHSTPAPYLILFLLATGFFAYRYTYIHATSFFLLSMGVSHYFLTPSVQLFDLRSGQPTVILRVFSFAVANIFFIVIIYALRMEVRRHRQTELELVAASEAKSRFLSNLSHELRTPLNGIVGTSEYLLKSELTGDQREAAEILFSASLAMLPVVNDLLDYSRLQSAEGVDFEHQPTDIALLLEETVRLYLPAAFGKGIALTFMPPDEPLPSLMADPARIRQLASHLIANAIKFTHEGQIEVILKANQNAGACVEILVEIHDTGIGLPEGSTDFLFEPFTQADYSTSRPYDGAGLGLAICRKLVVAMDGTIGCRPSRRQGSCFFFSIPLSASACR
jgi:signal transduction histidine kinase